MPCGPICPASDALCIAGFKTGWRLWPPTRASFPGRGFPSSSPTAAKPLKKVAHKIGFGPEKSCALTICCTFISFFSSNCSKTPEEIAHEARFCSLPLSSLLPSFLIPQPYQIRLVMALKKPTRVVLAPSLSRLCCLVFFLPPTVSDTVGGPGGNRASDLKAPSLNCLVVHPPDPPKIQNPESKIQNSGIQTPKSKLFWLDFGVLDRYM